MKRILVPIDGSSCSVRAAEQAVSLAKIFGSEIVFLTVFLPNEDTSEEFGAYANGEYTTATDALLLIQMKFKEKILKKIVEGLDCKDIDTKIEVIVGQPHPRIVKYAKDWEADVIVMGHRGLNPLNKSFLGSVVTRVNEDAPCPVMIVQ